MRTAVFSTVLMFVFASPLLAEAPEGSWRMAVDVSPSQTIVFLLNFQKSQNAWSGKLLGATDAVSPESKIDEIQVNSGNVQFSVTSKDQKWSFEGRQSGNKILGTLLVDGQLLLTTLEPSPLTTFDRFALAKELFETTDRKPLYFQALQEMLRQATSKNVPMDEVRGWIERAGKAAEPYGARWRQSAALMIASALDGQSGFAPLALAEARKAEQLLDTKDEAVFQIEVLESLAKTLRASGNTEEAAGLATRIQQLEELDYQQSLRKPILPVDPFKGRKGVSDRVVLVEEFTCSELLSAISPDLAMEAIGRAYKPTEVVRLQYHLHQPSGDALSSLSSEARKKYYQVNQLPSLLLNGKLALDGEGGTRAAAAGLWQQLRAALDQLVEQPSSASIRLTVSRTDDIVTVKALVGGISSPSDKLRLRLALVEDVVRYRGGNGIRFHPSVVRGFVGGDMGLPVTKALGDFTETIDLGTVKKIANGSLDAYLKAHPETTFPSRPMAFKSLSVIAFIQDDGTREILQATRAEVR